MVLDSYHSRCAFHCMEMFRCIFSLVFKITEWLENVVFTNLEKGRIEAFSFVIMSCPTCEYYKGRELKDVSTREEAILEVFKFNFESGHEVESTSIIEQTKNIFNALLHLLKSGSRSCRKKKGGCKISMNFVMELKREEEEKGTSNPTNLANHIMMSQYHEECKQVSSVNPLETIITEVDPGMSFAIEDVENNLSPSIGKGIEYLAQQSCKFESFSSQCHRGKMTHQSKQLLRLLRLFAG